MLSFVPPDRYFTIMEYRVIPRAGIAAAPQISPPLVMKPTINLKDNGGMNKIKINGGWTIKHKQARYP